MNASTSNAHLTTDYILQDEKGGLHMYRFRPTDAYAGRRDSDQYALMLGMQINEPSHDLLGSIDCRLVQHSHSGPVSSNTRCYIVAKRSHVWDYSQPIGKRESNVVATNHWDSFLTKYRAQAAIK